MKFNGSMKWIKVQYQNSSLYNLIADGQYRPTQIGRQKWRSLISGSSLQANCNQEGFNVKRVRIGIIANEQYDCNTPDSSIGLGGVFDSFSRESSGNFALARYGSDNGDRNSATWGYVFVQ